MTDSSGRERWASADNPLYDDPALFNMYRGALDVVLRTPEIRQACHEFGVSLPTLRMKMTNNATRVFEAAPREFDAYRRATAEKLVGLKRVPVKVTRGADRDSGDIVRLSVKGAAAAGVLMIIGGAVSSTAWGPMAALAEAGAAVLVVAALAWGALKILENSRYFEEARYESPGGIDLDILRSQLMVAVSETELIAQIRTYINDAHQDRFGHQYSAVGAPGLSEVYDSTNRISTRVSVDMDDLLGRFDGASIGVAGPRGAGKSTLVRKYCDEGPDDDDDVDYGSFDFSWLRGTYLPSRRQRDLRCFVAAPVDYVTRDFVLHLFATFCQAVIGRYSARNPHLPGVIVAAFWLRRAGLLLLGLLWRAAVCTAVVLVLMHWKQAIAQRVSISGTWVDYAAIAVICLGVLDFARSAVTRIRGWARQISGKDDHALTKAARMHLSRVRYLQTFTSGWSGTLQIPWGKAGGQYSRNVTRAEQPHSYPEIVDEFRDFARDVAAQIHLQHNRVFIGIDELDKIGSAEQAERFLNEIKGIFGIPHVYFMVSVSDDALTAFERRGLPLRNAFDSSFDEIVNVGPLSYDESLRLLYRRVIGLSEPYVALCHCLAGGLARDVIRAARQIIRVGVAIQSEDPSSSVAQEAVDSAVDPAVRMLFPSRPTQAPPTLAAVAAKVIHDELIRKVRAVSQVVSTAAPESSSELHDTLHQISQTLTLGQPVIQTVDLMIRAFQGEPTKLSSLRLEFAAYAYYCATLQEVFTGRLDRDHMIAATSVPAGPDSFEALAGARAAFSVDTLLAWRLITQFRKTWSLETREPGEIAAAATSSGQRSS